MTSRLVGRKNIFCWNQFGLNVHRLVSMFSLQMHRNLFFSKALCLSLLDGSSNTQYLIISFVSQFKYMSKSGLTPIWHLNRSSKRSDIQSDIWSFRTNLKKDFLSPGLFYLKKVITWFYRILHRSSIHHCEWYTPPWNLISLKPLLKKLSNYDSKIDL